MQGPAPERTGPRAVSRAHRIDDPIDIARPFVWIAALFFIAGFSSYLTLSPILAR
jgi:hypothetical protein